jgi:ankyrin repeat protein
MDWRSRSLLVACRNGDLKGLRFYLKIRWVYTVVSPPRPSLPGPPPLTSTPPHPTPRRSDPNESMDDGWSALHFAADRWDSAGTAIVAELLAAGADPTRRTKVLGLTPLHLALDSSNTATIKALLEYGAPPNATDARGLTPLHLACKRSNAQAVAWLLQLAASPAACTLSSQRTPLHLAVTGAFSAASGDVKCVRLLIRAGAPLAARDRPALDTPLHVAVRVGDEDIVAALLDGQGEEQGVGEGGDDTVNAANAGGDTAEMLAVRYGRTSIAARIRRKTSQRTRTWLVRLVALVAAGRAQLRRGGSSGGGGGDDDDDVVENDEGEGEGEEGNAAAVGAGAGGVTVSSAPAVPPAPAPARHTAETAVVPWSGRPRRRWGLAWILSRLQRTAHARANDASVEGALLLEEEQAGEETSTPLRPAPVRWPLFARYRGSRSARGGGGSPLVEPILGLVDGDMDVRPHRFVVVLRNATPAALFALLAARPGGMGLAAGWGVSVGGGGGAGGQEEEDVGPVPAGATMAAEPSSAGGPTEPARASTLVQTTAAFGGAGGAGGGDGDDPAPLEAPVSVSTTAGPAALGFRGGGRVERRPVAARQRSTDEVAAVVAGLAAVPRRVFRHVVAFL